MLTLRYFVSIFAFLSIAAGTPTHTSSQVLRRDDNLPARVPYVFPPPGTDPVADSLRARRPNNTLLDLDGLLLNSDVIANGWNSLFTVLRGNLTIPGIMRELLILRTGALNNAAYEWIQHEPVGREEGLTTPQLLEIRLTPPFLGSLTPNTTLTPELSAALLFADWVTNAIHVPQPVFDNLRTFLSDEQMVEVTALVSGYALVSRFVVVLNADDKMDVPVPIPQ